MSLTNLTEEATEKITRSRKGIIKKKRLEWAKKFKTGSWTYKKEKCTSVILKTENTNCNQDHLFFGGKKKQTTGTD